MCVCVCVYVCLCMCVCVSVAMLLSLFICNSVLKKWVLRCEIRKHFLRARPGQGTLFDAENETLQAAVFKLEVAALLWSQNV